MSKPSIDRLFSSSRSSGVEKIRGAGVFSIDEKSCSVGNEDLSRGRWSESVDDTERRFVRTGVRVGNAGGALFEPWEVVVVRDKEGLMGIASDPISASDGSSSCTLDILILLSSRARAARRRVASLGFRWTIWWSSDETTSTAGSSAVEGVEGAHSEDAEWKLASEAPDDTCGATREGDETSVGDAEREAWRLSAAGTMGSAAAAV